MTMWCGWRGPLVDIDRPGFVAMATSGSDETAKLTFEEISKLQERKVRRWARARGGGFGGKHSTHTRSVMRPFRRCVLFGVWRVFESACPCVYECMLSASACAVCGQCSACVTRCVVFALASAAFLQCSGVCVCVFFLCVSAFSVPFVPIWSFWAHARASHGRHLLLRVATGVRRSSRRRTRSTWRPTQN